MANAPTVSADERAELAYLREVAEHEASETRRVFDENLELKLASRPEHLVTLAVEQVMVRVDARIAAIVEAFGDGVVAMLLPRVENIMNATRSLLEMEQRQLTLELKVRMLADEPELQRRMDEAARLTASD